MWLKCPRGLQRTQSSLLFGSGANPPFSMTWIWKSSCSNGTIGCCSGQVLVVDFTLWDEKLQRFQMKQNEVDDVEQMKVKVQRLWSPPLKELLNLLLLLSESLLSKQHLESHVGVWLIWCCWTFREVLRLCGASPPSDFLPQQGFGGIRLHPDSPHMTPWSAVHVMSNVPAVGTLFFCKTRPERFRGAADTSQPAACSGLWHELMFSADVACFMKLIYFWIMRLVFSALWMFCSFLCSRSVTSKVPVHTEPAGELRNGLLQKSVMNREERPRVHDQNQNRARPVLMLVNLCPSLLLRDSSCLNVLFVSSLFTNLLPTSLVSFKMLF